MSHRTPEWWYKDSLLAPVLLSPISFLYGMAVRYRWRTTKPHISALPVICVGNFTMGGAGKTPTALYIASLVRAMGETPAFLSRGYGGKIRGPHRVDPETDLSLEVGDEPLLLARCAPTVISADRKAGATFIEQLTDPAPTVIIMDDGYQNPTLHKTINIVVVDGERGVGNGRVFPSGPLREALPTQLARMDAMITIGGDSVSSIRTGRPHIMASIHPEDNAQGLSEDSVIAYTGIARPSKFYKTLKEMGFSIKQSFDFPDHHQFTEDDVSKLIQTSERKGCSLITTEKDIVRLAGRGGKFEELRNRSRTVPITLALRPDQKHVLRELIEKRLNASV